MPGRQACEVCVFGGGGLPVCGADPFLDPGGFSELAAVVAALAAGDQEGAVSLLSWAFSLPVCRAQAGVCLYPASLLLLSVCDTCG